MCELHAYLVGGDKEELVVQNVEAVESKGKELLIRDIFGYLYSVTARLSGIDMAAQRIVLIADCDEKASV